ncbi:LAGLIDADG family homing endonuclease [Streptomyces sp. GQFP]|uniref:LAGLIDADG family homing endonuclease n=1 Tax=Streptomyces sp. GQFP TaxID=2907545 RepID=UPI001F1FDC9A|nr:LAGLIDADG family homing endonuclease [Streptomyces sp. GQFP]UIX31793.1 LAGLIDADG family homing endonuclease [Streptomyces sp. GQFP]
MADCEPSAHRFMDLAVPEYAYMFGFIQADGHLKQGPGKKGRLSVEINARDIDLLRKFQKLTPYYSSVTERTRSTNFAETHRSATWSLCSLEARTRLNELGLPYGRKSKTIAPPHVEFSRRDYLRGVIDADGSVGNTSQGFPFVSLTTASTAIAAYLCFYAGKITGAERTLKRNARDGIYNILYTKENAQELAADLYYKDCLSLQRKQTAADSLSAWIRPADMRVAPDRRRWTAQEDRMLLQLNNDASAAKELGRTEKSCYIRLWRLRTGKVPLPIDR